MTAIPTLPAALVSGRIDASVGAMAANTIAAAAIATDAKAVINAEVVDALATDTYAEPGQGAPGATISIAAKIGDLFKAFRTKIVQTATEIDLYNDAGAVVDQKAPFSDDTTTATRGKIVSGP